MNKSGLADSPLFKKSKRKKQPFHHATASASAQDIMLATIQTSVMGIGKEAATYRLTLNEKRKVTEIIYSLKMKNIRTTENEIIRIALNFLLFDYANNKSNNILKRCLHRRRKA